MKIDQNPKTGFLQTVSVALARLKQRLQQEYEQAYPELREIIRLVIDQEETKAWELTSFPHLLLPDLVEAHIATLNLRSTETLRNDVLIHHDFTRSPAYEPAFACFAS